MSLRVTALLLGMAVAGPALAIDWSVCPGWDQADQARDAAAGASAPGTPSTGYWGYVSPYTYHWSDENKSKHKPVFALSISRQLPNERFCGFSLFRNSFGQPSAYAFTGWSWPHLLNSNPNVYATVSAGIVYGYVGEFKNKVPLNIGGFSPVIVPAIGYRLTPQLGVEMHILGTAAVMFGASWHF